MYTISLRFPGRASYREIVVGSYQTLLELAEFLDKSQVWFRVTKGGEVIKSPPEAVLYGGYWLEK
jgi:hypothetical protein